MEYVMDSRVNKLAQLLINYSLKLKKGKFVKIQGESVSLPLMKALYAEALKVGAYPYVSIRASDCEELFYRNATDDQLQFVSPLLKLEIDRIDAHITIWGSENTRYLAGVDPKRMALQQKAMRPLIQKRFKRMGDGSMNWVGTQYPTLADAQEGDMSLSDYESFVYGAGHLDAADPITHWKKIEQEQERLVKVLNTVDQVHVRSNDTDLKVRVKGRKWISCHGTKNFPDGEIFTGPIEDSAEGHIRYSFPAVYQGREVTDVRLEFKKGKVVKETAGKNLEFLKTMLGVDKGARFVGEFAIGTNYDIKNFTRNTLFDEKIGGTCHLALGASIPESLGRNKSAIHWDMVCDLRAGSEITADGKTIYRNGKFVI
jgi:aminopeptidase